MVIEMPDDEVVFWKWTRLATDMINAFDECSKKSSKKSSEFGNSDKDWFRQVCSTNFRLK